MRYDFGQSRRSCAPGLSAIVAYARGRRPHQTRRPGPRCPTRDELDLDVTWDVPRVKGLQLRFRNAYVEAGGPDTGFQFRLIVNWEIDLF